MWSTGQSQPVDDDDDDDAAAAGPEDALQGATIHTSSGVSGADLQAVKYCRLTMKKFYCVRKQNDSIFLPKNEIYWLYASANETRA